MNDLIQKLKALPRYDVYSVTMASGNVMPKSIPREDGDWIKAGDLYALLEDEPECTMADLKGELEYLTSIAADIRNMYANSH